LPDGKTEIVVSSTAGLTGYDPESGAVNWDWTWKFPTKPLRTVGSPILANGVLVAISGDGDGSRSTVAVEPGRSARRLWQKEKADHAPYVPGPLILGDHLYWVSDTGFVVCTELKSGKAVWSERALPRGVTASPVMVNGHVIAIDEGGRAIVFKATPDGFEKVAQNEFGEPVFASPAVAGGKLFVRGTTHLFCVGKE
jgi:outer membrane protein assembly factor BamB